MRTLWLTLAGLFSSYGLAGWLLSFYHATPVVWLGSELLILYLTWVGTGAIALAIVGSMGLIGAGVLSSELPDHLVGIPLPLNQAQVWALMLILSWVWALFVIWKLAFTVRYLRLMGWRRSQVFLIVFLIVNLGLKLGQTLELMLL